MILPPARFCRGMVGLAAAFALSATATACSGPPSARVDGPAAGQAGLPSHHVHGVDVNPGDGRVYLATHEGLFRYDEAGPTRVGPQIDLMGFAVAGADHFYASGHPGPGTDLPDPVGLIESTDAGRTWTALSRQQESDFHALAVTSQGVIGFDGALRLTSDRRTWQQVDAPVRPHALAAAPTGTTVVATMASGVMRSPDGGRTWVAVPGAPRLMLVDWVAGETVVGVTQEGVVAVSADGGRSWTTKGQVPGPPQAIGGSPTDSGGLRVLVVTGDRVLSSPDGGSTFTPLSSAGAPS